MAMLGPLFVLPLARVERRREAACVEGALISVEVMCDIVGTQRLLTIADARIRQPAMDGIGECALERTRQRGVGGGRFTDEKNPAIMLSAVVCAWVRNSSADFCSSGIVEGRGGSLQWLVTVRGGHAFGWPVLLRRFGLGWMWLRHLCGGSGRGWFQIGRVHGYGEECMFRVVKPVCELGG